MSIIIIPNHPGNNTHSAYRLFLPEASFLWWIILALICAEPFVEGLPNKPGFCNRKIRPAMWNLQDFRGQSPRNSKGIPEGRGIPEIASIFLCKALFCNRFFRNKLP
jgi:hypothetical protein